MRMTKIKNNQMRSQKLKTAGFYTLLVILPLTQFVLFYVCVNFNSILLALKSYDPLTLKVEKLGFQNFSQIFYELGNQSILPTAIKNSVIAFVINVAVGMSSGLIFSYYIFKKLPMSDFFKVVLFLPSIVSSIVMVIIFNSFVESTLPYLVKKTGGTMTGLLSNADTKFATIIFYNLWIGFGTQILMYVGAMNNISDGVMEAAKTDGANSVEEFLFIVFPLVYPTVVVFITVNIVSVFTNQLNLFSFYGKSADNDVITIGYYLYRGAQLGVIAEYPYYAALGILCTLIAFPVTVLSRKLLNKFGPSED